MNVFVDMGGSSHHDAQFCNRKRTNGHLGYYYYHQHHYNFKHLCYKCICKRECIGVIDCVVLGFE